MQRDLHFSETDNFHRHFCFVLNVESVRCSDTQSLLHYNKGHWPGECIVVEHTFLRLFFVVPLQKRYGELIVKCEHWYVDPP